jgi:ABC-type bacteriocin/lantibiotic exporter with double-glycine peptidase domain
LSYIVIALIYGWQLCLVLLACAPFITACAALMYIMTNKYKKNELKAYENAGQIANSVLNSIRTVYACGLQKQFIQMYKENLEQVEQMTAKKGFFYGLFRGAVDGLFVAVLGTGLLYIISLIQSDCEKNTPTSILTSFYCTVQSYGTLGPALAFLSNLSQGI